MESGATGSVTNGKRRRGGLTRIDWHELAGLTIYPCADQVMVPVPGIEVNIPHQMRLLFSPECLVPFPRISISHIPPLVPLHGKRCHPRDSLCNRVLPIPRQRINKLISLPLSVPNQRIELLEGTIL